MIAISSVMTQDYVLDQLIFVMDILIADMEMMKRIVVMKFMYVCIHTHKLVCKYNFSIYFTVKMNQNAFYYMSYVAYM